MHYYLDHPEELKKKQEDGYEFVRKYGTNEYTFNYMNNNNIFKYKMNTDLKITLPSITSPIKSRCEKELSFPVSISFK